MGARTCFEPGCPVHAKWAAVVRVPAMGHSLDDHKPLTIQSSVLYCDGHKSTAKVRDFVGNSDLARNIKDAVNTILASMRRVKPDFGRAWLEFHSVDSVAFAEFESSIETKQ